MKGLQEQLRRHEGEIKWKMRNKKKHFTFINRPCCVYLLILD